MNWKATGPTEPRGKGAGGDEAAFSRFSGDLAAAKCTARMRGSETGFGFSTGQLDADGYYANLGTQKNGSYL